MTATSMTNIQEPPSEAQYPASPVCSPFRGAYSRRGRLASLFLSLGFGCLLGLFFGGQGVLAAPTSMKPGKSQLRARAAAISAQADSADLLEWAGKAVSSVQVSGNQRIEKEAILAKIATRPGGRLSVGAVRSDIEALFKMGFFEDIEVRGEADGELVRVVFALRERPVISKIVFDGNTEISTSDLEEVAKVKQWMILDTNKVKEDVSLLQKHYEEKGFYLAKVASEVRPVEGKPEWVELRYKIQDFDKVRIKKITFLNNRAFSDEQLKALLQRTREGGLLSFVSGSGSFRESTFKQDLQFLTYWYLDHGYVKFRFENPIVTVSDDKKWVYITLSVDEGVPYKIGNLDFSGDLLFTKEELQGDVTLTSGELFSISKRNADIQKLSERYQDLGYAFANVVPKMDLHDDTQTVDLDYGFEKGNLVYFGQINVVGNTKTYDKVIRRELRIYEGELYSGTKLRVSRENVERLGFFAPGEVVFNTIASKEKPDVLNVEISVKERSTGTITLGAGYGSVQKFFFTTQVSEINMLGKGQSISLSAQLAADQLSKSFNLGFTDPYAFDTRWSAGFDLFYVNLPIPGKYVTRKLGGDVRLGYPIGDYTLAFITYKNEGLKINPDDRALLQPFPDDVAADSGVLSSLVFSLVRDRRNNRFETTEGNYQSISLETAGLGGDKSFIKTILNSRFYKRLIGDLVFRNNLEYGHIFAVPGYPVPPAERFYLGGPNNLKGFDLFSLGPRRQRLNTVGNLVTEPTGGLVQMYGIFELEYPLIREAGLKFVTFFDAGNAFARFPQGDEFKILTDAGFGFRWFSPIGPLRFEWGYPLAGGNSVFQFFIGPPF